MRTVKIIIVVLGLLGVTMLGFTQANASSEKPTALRAGNALAPLSTFVVTNVTDSGDNTNPGTGTLRRALLNANSTAGFDHIVFDLPGSGVKTIVIKNYLPDITDPRGVWLDGRHKTDGSLNDDQIEIDGSLSTDGHYGFKVTAGNNVVEGLTLNGFDTVAAIALIASNNNKIIGNRLGTNPAGTLAKPNYAGIQLIGASNNVIGGTEGVRPGGACVGSCNVIAGNRVNQLVLQDGSQGNKVIGNFIGVNQAGTAALQATGDGILIGNAFNNIIGGPTPQERNVISGNGEIDIEVGLAKSSGNLIQGNFIGTNSAGNAIVTGPGKTGIMLQGNAAGNLIDGNVISGHTQSGIFVTGAPRTEIRNNRIGMAATTDAKMGNLEQGIRVKSIGTNIHHNRIAYSGRDGINIDLTAAATRISENAIFDNVRFGINSSAKHLTGFPTIKSAVATTLALTVKGTFIGLAGQAYTIEVFQNPVCDLVFNKAVGEGKVFVGSAQVTTDATGTANFVIQSAAAPKSGVVTSTVTDNLNNTSEFSYCKPIAVRSAPPLAPEMVAPLQGETVEQNPPKLDWNPSKGTTRYVVVVKYDSPTGPIASKNRRVKTDQYTPQVTLGGNSTLYWTVKACNADNSCSKPKWSLFYTP